MAPPHVFGPFVFDPAHGLLRGGEPVAIGHRGMALLEADGQPVVKARLFELAWPGTIVEEVNLSVQIAALRRALGRDAEGREWITTVPRVGYCLPRPGETPPGPTGLRRASIVVLPFSNMSSDPEQDYFADGVVEDLITALSRFKSFAVVARSSSFAYKDRAADVRVVAEELGVRYVLEGSVQRRGGHLRVTAQLIEGETGIHLWAESFDGELSNLFDFQDRITEAVVGLIEPEIRKAEIERARRRRPEDLDAYDLLLRAMPLFHHFSDGTTTERAPVGAVRPSMPARHI
jgi:TolB-like protein